MYPTLRRSDDTSHRRRCSFMADIGPRPVPPHAPTKRRAADAATVKLWAEDPPCSPFVSRPRARDGARPAGAAHSLIEYCMISNDQLLGSSLPVPGSGTRSSLVHLASELTVSASFRGFCTLSGRSMIWIRRSLRIATIVASPVGGDMTYSKPRCLAAE